MKKRVKMKLKKERTRGRIKFCEIKIGIYAVAEPDKKLWGGRNQNKLKYINHIIYNTTHFGSVHQKIKLIKKTNYMTNTHNDALHVPGDLESSIIDRVNSMSSGLTLLTLER